MDRFFNNLQGDSPILQAIGKYGYKVYEERELVFVYSHLLISAIFPIYIGSHASLQRPPSAKAPPKSKSSSRSSDESDDDDLEVEPTREGLSPSDAILFPLLAGLTLSLLYFIIKVLKNAALLNKILGWYFSSIGIFGVGKLAADGLNVLTTIVFPNVWSTRTTTYYIDPLLSQQVTGEVKPARTQTHRKFTDKSNPFPGIFSNMRFSSRLSKHIWALRTLLRKNWILRIHLHGIVSSKSKLRLNDITGFLIGVVAIILYNTASKPWWLTNLIGFGFCYGTLQLMSPTTFWTGSLVLAGLFIYDITMVFYTPLMVTVATQLDVPIKLVIPGGKKGRGGMLGLGDVVLPGIMMALALRFDLYLHYLRKQRSTSTPSSADSKPEYIEATSSWGDRFWTRSLSSSSPALDTQLTTAPGGRFKKTYFNASIVGYIFGMSATLIVLNVYNHAQPALLYLVPGVLGAVWGTALITGEVKDMWEYTEDGSLETTNELDAGEAKKDEQKKVEGGVSDAGSVEKDRATTAAAAGKEQAHHVFLFSLSEPRTKRSLSGKGGFSNDVVGI
jgi:minor histocompatibility antigen H13